MKGIYNIRTLFEKYYSEYGNYIDAAAKFVTALILFMQINGRIGGKSIFGNIFVELILALVCAILPPNVMIVLAFVAALLQFASVSIASLAVGGGVLLAVLLLYFAFASKQAVPYSKRSQTDYLPLTGWPAIRSCRRKYAMKALIPNRSNWKNSVPCSKILAV